MTNSINSLLVSSLFGQSSSSSGVSSDLLASWAASRAGVGASVADTTADPKAPLAPVWQPGISPSDASLTNRALSGKAFFDTNAKLYSDLAATGDYKKLFALYSGVSTLQALASRMSDTTLKPADKTATQAAFDRGLAELQSFFAGQSFDDVRLAQGDRVDQAQTTLAIPSTSEDYTTGIVQKGGLTGALTGLDPNARFDIVATSSTGTERRISIDLSQMGSIPRSLSNVVGFINSKLAAGNALSRLATVDQTPKSTNLVIGGKVVAIPYTGAKQYALKVDVIGGEKVAFEPVAADPAFYVVGQTSNGARLIKLSDTGGDAGQPVWLQRPNATAAPIGPDVATGWMDTAGAAYVTDTNALTSDAGPNNFEDRLRAAGEAVLKLTLADGRQISVSTAWRSDDLEGWRVRGGETEDQGILGDVAQRLTQLLHEQGVAAGVTTWTDGDEGGLSVITGDGVAVTNLAISGSNATLAQGDDPPGMVAGLRDGVYARSFEAANIAASNASFVGTQTVTFTGANSTQAITVEGGQGIDAATFLDKLNTKIRMAGLSASASFIDNAGVLTLHIDSLHDLQDVSVTVGLPGAQQGEIDTTTIDGDLQPPPVGVLGGLPLSSAGQPFADAVRETVVSGSPLSTYAGALDIQLVVATPTGNKTVSVAVSASERALDPDPAPGEWSAAFQSRLNTALNAAGVYVGAQGADLTHWLTAEDSGQRIASISINGVAQTLTDNTPSSGLGGAFSIERSFTSAQGAAAAADDIAALQNDPNVSISFNTVWGQKTISAALDPGDPRTLESAALRLNEALAAAGYDLGVETTDLSGGGAGLRVVAGNTHTVRGVTSIALGGTSLATSLDAVDSQTHATDPMGAAAVASRAARGAAITETVLNAGSAIAPSAAGAGWFPGRAFDIAIGGDAKVATARAVATGADGSVFVLADLGGDSASLPIKGARDVALLKYDSAGKLAFTRILGASDAANGYALVVSADGKVAVAGSVQGDLAGAGAAKGGTDSFVALYDSSGSELWKTRRGASANDEVRAVAFAPDGSVIVAGKTASALGPALAAGGTDAYVRGFSASGGELFVKQFGTGNDDAATALLVRDDGAGGAQIFTGGVEDNRGVVRSFSYSANAGFAVGATRDIGYFYKGAINTLAADGNDLFVGGGIGADRLTLGTPSRGAVAGQEGFVARVSTNLASAARDQATYLGSAQDDSVTGLAIVNHVVYASGVDGGVLAGQGTAKAKTGFLARLDSSGAVDWTRSFASAGGVISAASLAVDTSGASPLDVLGLPRGVVAAADSKALVQRSGVRAGEEFKVGVDARHMSTITIAASDTMASLAAKINRAIGANGRAAIVKDNGAERIKITASDGRDVILDEGRAGKSALAGLGLSPGIIAVNATKRGSVKTFGLGLNPADLKLTDAAAIAKTKAELSAAISIVRQAYDALLHPNAKPQTAEEAALAAKQAAAGQAPAYYTAQIANYQAALARLGGG